MSMTGKEIRRTFLEFFERHGHEAVPSSALVPRNDDTLLFTNAGMVQFKEIFLGREERGYTTAASSQRCVRAGGKHNDLESVGRTARHLTYFEMLGNFSFGDYFKRKAIELAWEYLTEVVKLPKERLYATVYEQDDEAYGMFEEVCKLPKERIFRCGAKDNFWAMGDTGPCGPCAEFHYDRGPAYGPEEWVNPDLGKDRLIEIWNLVFMQFDRDASGTLTPLPKPCIDTGMGLERIAAISNAVDTVYDTDLLLPLVERIAGIARKPYRVDDRTDVSLRVIADHARSTSFLISDGVLPSNEGRGYVLRRIMRRALRHGRMLGIEEHFFSKMAEAVIELFQDHYHELADNRTFILNVVRNEEERFSRTLRHGMEILAGMIEEVRAANSDTLSGERAFALYDTYGFPLDLTREILEDANLLLDEAGYASAMEAQSRRAREAHVGGKVHSADPVFHAILKEHGPTEFRGYREHNLNARVVALVRDAMPLDAVHEAEDVEVFLDHTPFYAESGGQVGDSGELRFGDARIHVVNCVKILPELFKHIGKVTRGTVKLGDECHAWVDLERLNAISRNHTGTHILHWALRDVLGDHVHQAGSLVAPDRLRFDFTHFAALSPREVEKIELLINSKIQADDEVGATVMPIADALKSGAMALFGEKYGDMVRVVNVGTFSKELCGGIHVQRSGQIGSFLVAREEAVASGVRRIEALTGEAAAQLARASIDVVQQLSGTFNTSPDSVVERARGLQQQVKSLEREVARLKNQLASATAKDPMESLQEVNGVPFITHRVEGMDMNNVRNLVDELKGKLKHGLVVVASVNGDAVSLVAGVTKELAGKVHAGNLLKRIAAIVGGSGGGRPDMAQAGGKDSSKVDEALADVKGYLECL